MFASLTVSLFHEAEFAPYAMSCRATTTAIYKYIHAVCYSTYLVLQGDLTLFLYISAIMIIHFLQSILSLSMIKELTYFTQISCHVSTSTLET